MESTNTINTKLYQQQQSELAQDTDINLGGQQKNNAGSAQWSLPTMPSIKGGKWFGGGNANEDEYEKYDESKLS